jgi:hypothetical protein
MYRHEAVPTMISPLRQRACRSRGITVLITSSNTVSSWGAACQVWGQYRTNSSMPISPKRPTMSSKYGTDRQGVSGGSRQANAG